METLYRKVKCSKRLPENYKNDCSKFVHCILKKGRPITCYYNHYLKAWKTDKRETIIDIKSWLEELQPQEQVTVDDLLEILIECDIENYTEEETAQVIHKLYGEKPPKAEE